MMTMTMMMIMLGVDIDVGGVGGVAHLGQGCVDENDVGWPGTCVAQMCARLCVRVCVTANYETPSLYILYMIVCNETPSAWFMYYVYIITNDN